MALKSSREGLRKESVDYLGNLIVDDNLRNEIIKALGDKFVTPEVLNENVNNLIMQITTESGERIEADDTLQSNIIAEATAREQADTTLQNNITAEATAREQADTTLQNNINAETTARQEDIRNLENLIGTSGLQMDLLWTNASSTSDFASQTIPLDLSKYKCFCFSATHYKTASALNEQCAMSTIGIVDSSEGAMCVTKYNDNAGSRFAKATKTGVIFGNAYANFTNDMTINNTRAIPYRIYGVK